MPKPTNKIQLKEASNHNYKKLIGLVNSFSEEVREAEFSPGTMNRNIRDVLAHLHHWHLLLIDWYEAGIKGKKPSMPAKNYAWKDTPALNKKIFQDYQVYSLNEIMQVLNKSFSKIQNLINDHTDEELFEKGRYQWTGSTSLAAYLIANTSSHYNWAYKIIKKAKSN